MFPIFPSPSYIVLNKHFLSNCRTGNELHEPKFSEDDMEFIVEEKNIKKEVKGQYQLPFLEWIFKHLLFWNCYNMEQDLLLVMSCLHFFVMV